MLKYFIPTIALLLLFTGCSSQKSPEMKKYENDKLMHNLFTLKTCRIESAKRLDDGISSAEVIAAIVIQECMKESNYVMDNNMYDNSQEYREHFQNQMNSVNTSGVINIILEQRREKKN